MIGMDIVPQAEYTPDPRGLYDKYKVVSNATGAEITDCFVLRLPDPHARRALRTYALCVHDENPQLATDILRQVSMFEDTDLGEVIDDPVGAENVALKKELKIAWEDIVSIKQRIQSLEILAGVPTPKG